MSHRLRMVPKVVGQKGNVVSTVSPTKNGLIHFEQEINRNKCWPICSDKSLKIGEIAEVISVEEDFLKVKV